MTAHPSTARRSRLRHGIGALFLLPLLLVLAGCFRLDMGLTINENDTLDVAMEIGDVTGFASRADMDCSELESELTGGPNEDVVDFSVTDIEDDDGNVGCRMEATGAPLDTLADDGGMSVQKVEDTYVFSFEGDPAGLGDMGELEDVPAGMEPQVSISVTFPGEVIETDTGEIDGNTVTWTGVQAFATGGTATGEATGSALGGSSNTVVWIVLGIVILLALAALIFFIVKRNKSGGAGSGATPAGAPYGGSSAHHPGQPEGGFGPGAQVPADPGAGYPGQQPPAAPPAFTTAAADTPVNRPEGESFAPPEPAAPEPQSAPPHGVPGEPDAGGQPTGEQHRDDEPPADQPR